MQTLKRLLTSWYLWAVIAGFLAIMVFQKNIEFGSLPFLALALICPVMMMLMMGSHHHKK